MISPIENNGMMVRTQDYAVMKQQDDMKTVGSEMHIQSQVEKKEDENVNTVHHADDSDTPDTNHDASREGRNKYYNNRQDKKVKLPEGDGRFFKKQSGGFDLKV